VGSELNRRRTDEKITLRATDEFAASFPAIRVAKEWSR
jgi:hypothetical protein